MPIEMDKSVKPSGYEQPQISNNIYNQEFKESVLNALLHLWKESGEGKTFWVSATQVNQWIQLNEMKDYDTKKIGRYIKKLGFKIMRKIPSGKYRLVEHKKLMKIIDRFNGEEAEFKKLADQRQDYENIKLRLFKKILGGKDITKEPYAVEILQRIGQEFIALGPVGAKEWVKENADISG